jgi:hypothetical protein
MLDRAAVLRSIYRAVDEVNLTLAAAQRVEKAEATVVFGAGARLDSLAFLNLMLAIESALNEGLDEPISLAENLMKDEVAGPPSTLGALATFILGLRDAQSAA